MCTVKNVYTYKYTYNFGNPLFLQLGIFFCINVFFRAKFGAEVGGGGGISSIFSIAKSQINKRKVTTKFEVNKNVKSDKKRKHKPKSDESGLTLEDRKVKLDHRQTKYIGYNSS